MKLKLFIDRPILAGVISVLILMLGIIGSTQLPIEQFPSIAPPTISVSANYAGASAETVMKSVIVPLEEAINGVENMLYMTSTASNSGSGNITVFQKGPRRKTRRGQSFIGAFLTGREVSITQFRFSKTVATRRFCEVTAGNHISINFRDWLLRSW